jgi:uncharacterized Zn finger protein (UPF0148 family)
VNAPALYICPRCGNPGTQHDGYNYCTRCRNKQDKERRARGKPASAEPKVVVSRGVEEMAMKGFSPLSQEFLNRRLV